jgi:hypothetical protein
LFPPFVHNKHFVALKDSTHRKNRKKKQQKKKGFTATVYVKYINNTVLNEISVNCLLFGVAFTLFFSQVILFPK